jgi:hypothetical protein
VAALPSGLSPTPLIIIIIIIILISELRFYFGRIQNVYFPFKM